MCAFLIFEAGRIIFRRVFRAPFRHVTRQNILRCLFPQTLEWKREEKREKCGKGKKKSRRVEIPFFRGKFDADVSAFGRRAIHLLILWHQTFTSHSLNGKMKASTPDKCTRGLSMLFYFYSVRLWCTLSGLAFYSGARNVQRSFKSSSTRKLHVYIFFLA